MVYATERDKEAIRKYLTRNPGSFQIDIARQLLLPSRLVIRVLLNGEGLIFERRGKALRWWVRPDHQID